MLKLMLATLGILFFSFQLSFAQQEKGNPTEWPYGGTYDDSFPLKKARWNKPPITFNNRTNFIDAKFDSWAEFNGAKFGNSVNFFRAHFVTLAIFPNTIFNNSVYFRETKFDSSAIFSSAVFKNEADFLLATFKNLADFSETNFYGGASFIAGTFRGMANFTGSTFHENVNFSTAEFENEVNFERCSFGKEINLSGTLFKEDLDLRRAIFDSVETIYINHRTEFPVGGLNLYWDQFKAVDSLKIKLNPFEISQSTFRTEHYQKIETFYHRLRDNFIAQDDLASADAVLYELGWQKQEIYGYWSWVGFKQALYGWFFGWGYQPWKFLVFVIVPVIIGFAILWYFKFYPVLENAIFKKEIENASQKLGSQEGSIFLKVWHSVLFSASALLGLRFQKAWILKHKSFLFWVTMEWAVGIGLFVLFALLVKSNQFEYVKGLLGF